ncbi:MAG: alpha/beta fold hydrolase, partial [Sphingomonadales bacterium]
MIEAVGLGRREHRGMNRGHGARMAAREGDEVLVGLLDLCHPPLERGHGAAFEIDNTSHAEQISVQWLTHNGLTVTAVDMAPDPDVMGRMRMTVAIETIDHLIETISTANCAEGEPVQLFVREKCPTSVNGRTSPVVLFVHGGTYPGVADFDLPVEDYSWMDFLAARDFRVFAMDCVGYGYSSRHWMDDPAAAEADAKGPGCALRSPQSDWHDMDEIVEFIRERTGAESISLIGWSAGGPRAGGYAAIHPNKVDRLILLAPAYI